MSFYYDSNKAGFDGYPIARNIPVSPGARSYNWNVSSVPEGKYWIYAVVTDGTNQNRAYSTGPVVVDHAEIPVINLSKTGLNFGAERYGTVTSAEEVKITNSGPGTLNWQAVANQSWLTVLPASGIGDSVIEISVNDTTLAPGTYAGAVAVSDSKASNSPQTVNVTYTVYGVGADGVPFGNMDIPLEGSTAAGNIAISGWALDDVEVTRIQIKRSAHPNEPPSALGTDGLVNIGDGVFIKGARPDVEVANPLYPLKDRAGWGYMMLTNFLPNGGNGTFSLYVFAYDTSGHRVQLGRRTIIMDNANSLKPFGTLDTPGQGLTVSGVSYTNWGWALTPMPKSIPTDGSTIRV